MKTILRYVWDTVVDLAYLLWFLVQIIALGLLCVGGWLFFLMCNIFGEDRR